MAKFEYNLSEGSVAKQLLKFSIPFILSNLIQSLYSVADIIIVGQFSGVYSLSGVTNSSQINMLVTNAVIGLSVGGTVLIGQYMGSGKKKELKDTISTLFATLFVLAVVITTAMLFLYVPALRLIRIPEESFSEAKRYLFITNLGTIFIFAYNALSAVMRGMGDSKNPLKFVSIACFTNIALDLVLVGVLKMGAAGAALATIFSQALSVIICIVYLRRHKFIFDFSLSSFGFNRSRLRMLIKIGIPTLFNNITVSVSFLFLTRFANSLGAIASAAVGSVGRFNAFAILPTIAMSSAISAMSAQNLGAGKTDRAIKTMKIGMVISVCITYTIFTLVQLFPDVFIRIFNNDPALVEAGVIYIKSFSFDYLFVPVLFCLNGLFIGAGHTTFSLMNGIISSLLVRVPVAYILGKVMGMGLSGFGLGAPFAAGISLILALIFYFSGRWKKQVIDSRAEL